MKIAVDPDVFCNYNERYQPTFKLFEENKTKYCFVISEAIEKQYRSFLEDNKREYNSLRRYACAIVRHLLNGTLYRKLPVKADDKNKYLCDPNIECEILHLNPKLIALAATLIQARTQSDLGPTVALLLDRREFATITCGIKPSADSKQCIKMNDVVFLSAEETDYLKQKFIDPTHMVNLQQQSLHFEDQCFFWLISKYGGVGRTRLIIGNRDIDAFVSLPYGKGKRVILGECKLLCTEMSNTQQHFEALNQLNDRIELCRQTWLEQNSHEPNSITDGYVFSNFYPEDLTNIKNKSYLIEAETKVKIHLIRVKMLDEWQNEIAWDLGDSCFEDIT